MQSCAASDRYARPTPVAAPAAVLHAFKRAVLHASAGAEHFFPTVAHSASAFDEQNESDEAKGPSSVALEHATRANRPPKVIRVRRVRVFIGPPRITLVFAQACTGRKRSMERDARHLIGRSARPSCS